LENPRGEHVLTNRFENKEGRGSEAIYSYAFTVERVPHRSAEVWGVGKEKKF